MGWERQGPREHITLKIGVNKAGSRITLLLTLTLGQVMVNRYGLKMEARFACDAPVGENLLGRLAAAVAQG